ncbi:MAG: M23 family metallopeptidase [Deltaproteobacteria bacterium]|nr:M23 family metallopeptidase [Deltaproteobacteria bacterium]
MHPLIRAAVVVAALSALSATSRRDPKGRLLTVKRTLAQQRDDLSAVCPAGTVPDFDQCVTVPDDVDAESGEELVGTQNAHRDRSGRWTLYEQIPRLPDRPADFEAYRYPIPPPSSGKYAIGGYDLDRPDSEQRRGARLTFVGHGGFDLMQVRGTEVRLLPLEHQQGDAVVVFVGKLFGTSVVTKHTLREGGRLRDYIVLYGHLDASAPGLAVSAPVREGDLLGFVGDTGSEGLVHLHLEIRQVRDGVDPAALGTQSVVRPTVSIPCDPRNVLPLRGN